MFNTCLFSSCCEHYRRVKGKREGENVTVEGGNPYLKISYRSSPIMDSGLHQNDRGERNGAEDEGRTRDFLLGKEAFYH
jgi:hypothetical protein